MKGSKKITFPVWCIGVKTLSDNIFRGIADDGRWGILDDAGETLCAPTFDNVGEIDNDIIPLEIDETTRGYAEKEIKKYGLYNVKSKVFIPAEYDVCPEYLNGYYKITSKGLLGVINDKGAMVLKPEWKQIQSSNGYYVVSKIEKKYYSEIECFGLANRNGDLILETKYDDISVLRDGLYKVKEYKGWSIFNDEGRLTTETYDEIDIEGNYIIVSKNGLSGRLNEHAEKVIKSDDGNDLILPDKFEWGYDFKDGIAKVLINNCENFVDKSFNIVIVSENQISSVDKSVDYLVSKDNKGNYIFVLDEKYGIISPFGNILIDAKYQYLSHFADELYIAGIIKDGEDDNTYGIINIEGKTVFAFKYSTIEPYGGKVPHSYWSWDDRYLKEQIVIPENIEYWLILKKGYGLIDRKGKVCIQPIYEDIQKIGKSFLVKGNNKYGIISSDYTLVCKPKYRRVSSIGNGFWKVSIVSSLNDNNKSELFGILDSEGNERLEPIYQFIGDVNDERVAKGLAIINLKGRLGLVDENYNILAEPQYNDISEFKNGKALVWSASGGGTIDLNGIFTDLTELTKSEIFNKTTANFKTVKTLKKGFKIIQRNDSNPIYQYCAVIDKDNNIILPYKYYKIEELKNGMFLVSLCSGDGGDYGLLNPDFQEIISSKYASIQQIQDVFVVKNNRWGGGFKYRSNQL